MRLLALLIALSACGDDPACPAEIAGNSAEWTATDAAAECTELAEVLNGGLDLSGDCAGGSEAWRTQQRGDSCSATVESECDGIALKLACDVRSNGEADCDATVTSDELAAGSCRFRLRVR